VRKKNLIPSITNNTYYHEIKKGENLTEVANKYNISLTELVEINDIENENILEVGTKLKLKHEISIRKDSPTNEPPTQKGIDKLIKNEYGPLIIENENTKIEKRKRNFLKATHKNGKKFILHINCEKKEFNVRGIGRKWKGWMPAREKFEDELLNDFC